MSGVVIFRPPAPVVDDALVHSPEMTETSDEYRTISSAAAAAVAVQRKSEASPHHNRRAEELVRFTHELYG